MIDHVLLYAAAYAMISVGIALIVCRVWEDK